MMENRLMKWRAICGDKVYDEKSNPFSDIDKDNLDYFMLEGLDTIFKHNVKTGQFSINENNMCFLLNDKLVGKSNDVINYKEKWFMAVGDRSNDDFIHGYYTGWKEKPDDFDYLEILFWVDMIEQKLKLRVRATPNSDSVLNSTLTIVMNGALIEEKLEFKEPNIREEFIFEIF